MLQSRSNIYGFEQNHLSYGIEQIQLFLFTVSITHQCMLVLSPQYSYEYQLPVSGPFIFLVIVQPTPLRYQLSVSPVSQSHEVIVTCTCIKSLITILISYFYHLQVSVELLVSAAPSYVHQLLLSTTCNRSSLLLLKRVKIERAIRFSYSFLRLLATLNNNL